MSRLEKKLMQKYSILSLRFVFFFVIALIVKISLLLYFSSGYKDELFIPFISAFIEFGGNPWENQTIPSDSFPYPPLMCSAQLNQDTFLKEFSYSIGDISSLEV